MERLKNITLLSLCVFLGQFVVAQTGIYYFQPNNNLIPNAKIVAIEANESSLILLSELADNKYKYKNTGLINFNIKTQTSSYKTIETEDLYNLKFILPNKQNTSIFGNTTLNKSYKPIIMEIDDDFNLQKTQEEPVVFSTLISDVVDGINYRLILYTKEGKSERYNISLHKINLVTQKVEWLKKISSEQNEEADKIIIDPEGNFFILGKKYDDDVTSYVPILYKLDQNGNRLWKKGIDVPENFSKQSICLNENGHIIYMCGYTKNPTGFSETKLIELSPIGEQVKYSEIEDFSANGLIKLKNGNFFLYGSKFFVDQKQIVTKGKYVFVGKSLNILKEKALDSKDKPDVDLQTEHKTSSDFLTAKELGDGKIALGGKVFMPDDLTQERHNLSLLMLINADGTY